MKYRFEVEARSFEDYASGRVLYNAPGKTAFPVRLASEWMQRCFQALEARGHIGPYRVYDPCCGSGYLLTVAAMLHGGRIREIAASDIDSEVLRVAKRNLSLLTPAGLLTRRIQLADLWERFGKSSHADALESLERIEARLATYAPPITHVFEADAGNLRRDSSQIGQPDIVFTDLPYGKLAEWGGALASGETETFFRGIRERLEPGKSVVAVAASKASRLQSPWFRRLEQVRIGKRQWMLAEPV